MGLTAVALQLACGPSPQPLPPPIGINLSGLRVSEPEPGIVRVVGFADAVASADTIEVINVATDGVPFVERQLVEVASDGSFSADFEGTITDVFRLQAFAVTGAQTNPVDVAGVDTGALVPAPTIDCIADDLETEIALRQEQAGTEVIRDVTLTNEACGVEVTVSDTGLLTSDGWLLDGLSQVPSGLIDGATITFSIIFDPPVPREETNVVVFELFDGTTTERRIYTVRGLEP